ncbi:twin-arginine translocase subunit TatC [Desulfofustis limnaeus]|jgi:sec-independent protein translocase protein TatC|uniref:Sec-independent protein translocase protein TatC n=1 Tax=Desulfofustis limnaeus TaxID=2740163 RepID=A0ABN6M3I8_9BACT|nr:twin-arginine translocase subunit TatC [Desulfofustis limnaeus]MDX9896553.1 twin-arginine translocase subunit TatC [Desulfofustis sp.]BDD85859.1 Sec-independent protein translocase protein TatC [Desulfofustis limnaeus]
MEPRPALVMFIAEVRKSFRRLFVSIVVVTAGIFYFTPQLLELIQAHLAEKLYFFSVAGPFLAHVKLALFGSLYALMPWIITMFLKALGKPFRVTRGQLLIFSLFTCLLFYAGTIFCYFVTLPFGINFLLGFGSEELKPVISISRFVNFVTVFILVFGTVFELPILMVFTARIGLITRRFFSRNRKYALLLMAILAALLTPTPDVVNMLLMGGPLYILYEVGIIILRVMRIP